MVGMKIPDSPAVGNKMSLKAPFTAKDMLKLFTAAAGFSVCPVISTHDGFHICILYQHFKSRKIRFMEIFFRWLCIKLMTQSLRTGMNGKMLRTGSGLRYSPSP